MALERFFLQKFENCDFITKRKAQVFFYYSLFLLILLGLLLVLYTVMPISPELARKGYLGAAAIIFLVIMSLFFLRTGKLETAVWSYAVPTILVIIALRLINAQPAPETAFTTYIFYMPYMIVYVAVLLIGTVISGFLRVCVENRLLPRTTTVYPARTTDPTRFFGNADNR